VNRAVLVGSAAAVYVLAAWTVAPGFYDSGTPLTLYDWVCVPPIAGADSGVPAGSGHADIKVVNGASESASVYTVDGSAASPATQVVVGFLPGAFDVSGKTSVSVDIKPVRPCPNPPALHFATNTYSITASATLVKPANLVMVYSYLVPAPSFIYRADDVSGPWQSVGGNEGQQFTLQTTTSQLGYFGAGYPAGATTSGGASQLLPIAVAVLIVGVLVAGIPLAMVRRRRAADDVDEPDETDD
jgi:hypothetical protein